MPLDPIPFDETLSSNQPGYFDDHEHAWARLNELASPAGADAVGVSDGRSVQEALDEMTPVDLATDIGMSEMSGAVPVYIPADGFGPGSPGGWFIIPLGVLGEIIPDLFPGGGGGAGLPPGRSDVYNGVVLWFNDDTDAWEARRLYEVANNALWLGDLRGVSGAYDATDGQVLAYDADEYEWVPVDAGVSGDVSAILAVTQTAYDLLDPPDPNTLYLITGP